MPRRVPGSYSDPSCLRWVTMKLARCSSSSPTGILSSPLASWTLARYDSMIRRSNLVFFRVFLLSSRLRSSMVVFFSPVGGLMASRPPHGAVQPQSAVTGGGLRKPLLPISAVMMQYERPVTRSHRSDVTGL
ncbi:hypothetical protein FKM82_026441 [Ascaphus truei]